VGICCLRMTFPLQSGLSALLEAVPLGAYVLRLEEAGGDESLRIVFANGASEQMIGIEPADVTGALLGERFPQVLSRGLAATYRRAILDQASCDLGIVSYGDEEIEQQQFAVAVHPISRDTAVMMFDNLSTGRGRRTELAAIVDGADDAILSKNLDGAILTWNPAAERMYGYPASEAIGKSVSMLLPPDRPDEISAIFDRLRAGERVEHFETTRLHKDGRVIDISLTVSPLLDSQHRLVGAASIARDITDRRENEARLQRYAAIVEASEDAIVSRGLDGVISTWNRGAERLFGYTAGEMIGRRIDDVSGKNPFDGGTNLEDLREQLHGGMHPKPFETRMQRGDGSSVDVSVGTSPISDAAGEVVGVAGVIRDMTEHRRLEAQLNRSQKLEAIGSLAGGVAHDFNNVLTIIRGMCELVLGELRDEELRAKVGQIDLAAEHAAGLTRQLLAFSRQQVMRPEPTDLNTIVETTLELAERVIHEQIDLKRQLARGLPPVHVDRGQIQQVILNLCINARDAMARGGTITVRTSTATLDEAYASTHLDVTPGSYALLEVPDTGVGMDEETASRIFDPFFTTKSEGTGLGLATVHGIVRQSGGHIWVYSELGLGTTFKVYLPVATNQVAARSTVRPAARSFEGHETILVVEDNNLLRPIIAQMLEPHGYTVLLAADGVDALAVAAEHRGTIDLLLTDVVMPRLDGRELSEEILEQSPGTKVLFSSGYPEDTVVRTGIAEATVAFIQKPYVAADLLATIRAMFEQPL
jgi:two-component system, cell cycle sensor histidine kinase and response regulator CckA